MEPAKEIGNKEMNEIWRPVPGFEGYYEVSNLGRVRSLDRMIPVRKADGQTIYQNRRGALKGLTACKSGYVMVHLNRNNVDKRLFVHRLVAEAFLPKREGAEMINHLDYHRNNNRADNLEWTTSRENVRYSQKHMRIEHQYPAPESGIKHIHRSRNSWQFRVRRIGAQYSRTFTTMEAAIAAKEAYFHEREESLDQGEHDIAG